MSYSKCRGGMGDPVTSPSQVPSDLDLFWLNFDGSNPTPAAPSSPSTSTTSSPSTTSMPTVMTDTTSTSPLLLLGGVAVVAYFLFRKKR